jgi:Putative nucleotidyltransferase DUF294/Putative nucleotidyltransferase substrate binding domain
MIPDKIQEITIIWSKDSNNKVSKAKIIRGSKDSQQTQDIYFKQPLAITEAFKTLENMVMESNKKREVHVKFIEEKDTLAAAAQAKIHLKTPDKVDTSSASAIDEINREATQNRNELKGIRNQVIKDLDKHLAPIKIAENISHGMRGFLSRLYKEGEEKLGPPPCSYCVVGLGSLARNESGPFPDYDNLIIIDHQSDGSPESNKIINYFNKLNQHVADRVYRLGESESGLRFCHGNLNAPYQKYEYRYANEDALSPEARKHARGGRKELLDNPIDPLSSAGNDMGLIAGYVDSSPIIGDNNLYEKYIKTVIPSDNIEPIVIANLKRQVAGVDDVINPSPITEKTLPEIIHVKEQLLRLPQSTISSLALYYGIKETNNIARIKLLAEKGVLSQEFADRLIKAFEELLRLRVQVQSAYGEEFEVVSTGNWESFQKSKTILENKFNQLKEEESKLGMSFREAMLKSEIEIKRLEGDPKAKKDLEIQKSKLKELEAKNGIKEFYEDRLIKEYPKIAANQFYKETKGKTPRTQAFTMKDTESLQTNILPTLRELLSKVQQSLKSDGTFDPKAFRT